MIHAKLTTALFLTMTLTVLYVMFTIYGHGGGVPLNPPTGGILSTMNKTTAM